MYEHVFANNSCVGKGHKVVSNIIPTLEGSSGLNAVHLIKFNIKLSCELISD